MVGLMIGLSRPGLRDWILQRSTAVIMIVYFVVMLGVAILYTPHDFASWNLVMSFQLIKTITLLFFVSLYIHAWLGIKHVLMDYVKLVWLRQLLRLLILMSLGLYTVWLVNILWG